MIADRCVRIRSSNRQHQRMLNHRTFKTVLEKLDHVYDLLRGNPLLSQRLVQGGKLRRNELQDLLNNGHTGIGAEGGATGAGAGGGSKNHLDHMSFHGAAHPANAEAPVSASDREVELLFQILNSHKEGLLNRSDLLNELARWSTLAGANPTPPPSTYRVGYGAFSWSGVYTHSLIWCTDIE